MESMDRKLEETISIGNDSCTHLIADAVKNNYHVILAYYVTCIAEEAYKRKAVDAYCRTCKRAQNRIHACLECAFFGCFDESHMKKHAMENNHYFAVNINHGYLFCFKCEEYVYNEIFEDISGDYKLEARRGSESQSCIPWMPKAKEIALLKNKIKKISDKTYIGVRGIVNVGNNCCFICILQILIHNPLLRDFFLSDKHKCFIKEPNSCLTCELFVLFQECYSGITVPFEPKQFLKVLQKFIDYEVGFEPQDAFGIFEKILTGLESSCQKIHETDNCNCMIHQMFYGITQVSNECRNCEVTSPLPPDRFLAIMLDLKEENDSLVKILDREFLKPGLLSDYQCSTCKEFDTTDRHQTIKKLPAVICFHINCGNCVKLKTKSKKKKLIKKSTAFAFEDCIDMSDYLNSKGDIKLSNENRYYLFGVIVFKGHILPAGHLLAYVKQGRRWFECDDENVYERSLKEVLNCEPILLFYCKQL